MKEYCINLLKGIGMGSANVIPGVSGGTIALITGIFERLIHAIKSFNIHALRLLAGVRLREFAKHTDLVFLSAVFLGVLIAIVSLARLFDYLFTHYPVYIWAYFFGLVLASVYFVGRTVSRWSSGVVTAFIVGTAAAMAISVLNPARENNSFIYLVLCGVVAICSMILPGISGSFVLVLMGNYQLVAIDAINNRDMQILVPVIIGAAGGLLAFSHLLSWIFRRFRDQTISLLTGFILGSLAILWPWQRMEYMLDPAGNPLLKKGRPVVESYIRYIPERFDSEVIIALAILLAGVATIAAVELAVRSKPS
ncbi:MAG: DUF368 domain-containing protein [Bacteroidales bacterium]|nr:DUF368 domain-containing protein [Bacteroidales bacterium]